ncbi:hypothetical protein L0F63_007420, partial [Massospora cicadina]
EIQLFLRLYGFYATVSQATDKMNRAKKGAVETIADKRELPQKPEKGEFRTMITDDIAG